jgi:site-specific recombinase XerD
MTALGPIVYSFFERHLKADKGSIKSYRDAVKLFLAFVASGPLRTITRLGTEDLTAERVREFLGHLEAERGNHIRTRNQRLAGLHAFFNYLARQSPETLVEAQKVRKLPRYLEKNHRQPALTISNMTSSRHYSQDCPLAEGPRCEIVLFSSSCTIRELAFKK